MERGEEALLDEVAKWNQLRLFVSPEDIGVLWSDDSGPSQ